MRNVIKNSLACLTAFLLGGAVMYLLVTNTVKDNSTVKTVDESASNSNVEVSKVVVENNGISAAVSKVYDAVVMIENYQSNRLAGTGSGFVYKKDSKYGYIMTNYHVVSKNNSLKVLCSNNKKVDAVLLGGDEYLDIAIIRVPVSSVISVAQIGKTKSLKAGDAVFAIGTPVGKEYFNSVTSGIISGLDRMVTVSINSNNDWIMKVIQVDASINPGNSGGALLNGNGEVIGVSSMKLVNSSIEGMGFAIKIEDAMAHVAALESGKKIERPFLGINFANVTDKYSLYRQGITIDEKISEGVVVISVIDNTGAAKAGFKKGDVITKIDGEAISSNAYLKYVLYKHNVGDKVKVTYIRDGKEKTASVELSKSTN